MRGNTSHTQERTVYCNCIGLCSYNLREEFSLQTAITVDIAAAHLEAGRLTSTRPRRWSISGTALDVETQIRTWWDLNYGLFCIAG